MPKNMLIDSAHWEEIRVAVVDGEKLDKFDFEIPSKAHIKSNVYLAKIVRVEPALQAAFVDYGNDRHGFLSFSEIHHDYFQIPIGDRQDFDNHIQNAISSLLAESGESIEELDPKEVAKLRYQFYRRYKIQEVIKKRQIVLVQVTKEERGNKGAALTTYIALAGRYCVLMPNTPRGSGVSRKIINPSDRSKLKKIVADLPIENGSTVIRTAGVGHSKAEIIKDFSYLKKTWDEIRETTVKSTAPCLIHEEANIIKRAIRDLYSRDVESILVEGENGYKIAKSFIKKLMPSHSKKVKLYEDKKLPLFNKFKINDQINQIYSTRVNLPSGGYLIINTTEALISIDVNSGKSTRERNIAETALKTNLEAANEIARQCRLRDLAGLIVVDFIDMTEKRDNAQVERCLRDALREDKAKIQVGSISNFGLLEFSRQRLRSSIADANTTICSHCNGSGFIWSSESTAIQILRKIDETLAIMNASELEVTLSADVALYLMNNKRSFISNMEERTNSKIIFKIDNTILASDFKIEQTMQQITKEKSDPPIIEQQALIHQEEDREPKETSSPVNDKAAGAFKNNRRRHFRRKNNKERMASKAVNDKTTTDGTAVHLPTEEEILLSQESVVTHINKLAESYKEQEIMFNLQSPEEQIVRQDKKRKGKNGLWQKLLKKL
ncbi:MAG: ribonuclease E/G [Holosporaceae bacterium]|jgi:ribonuclease E|nr:ribonuclease E/G [Holosporaceae bacterium]